MFRVSRMGWVRSLISGSRRQGNGRESTARRRQLLFETLESRNLLSATSPSFAPIGDLDVPLGAPVHVGLDGDHGLGQDITYTVSSSDPLIEASILSGNRSWQLDVQDHGTMIFELFEGRTPRTTGHIIELIEDDFYDNKEFIRVVDNFVIQATGAVSPLEDFDDEFHLDLNHGQIGTLSMAKASEDDNNAEIFATLGPTPHLDFHHSVFGIITEGLGSLESIGDVPTGSGSAPVDPVVITQSDVIVDTENGTLFLKALGPSAGPIEITVTATDEDNNVYVETFEVTVVADPSNGKPFLEAIAPILVSPGEVVNVELNALDAEGDDIVFFVPGMPVDFPFVEFDPIVEYDEVFATVTPTETVGSLNVPVRATVNVPVTVPEGFYGRFRMDFFVYGNQSPAQGPYDYANFDRQIVIFDVIPETPTSVDLLPGSDNGSSDTDDVTSLPTLTFEVDGVTPGRIVKIFAGETEVGGAVVAPGQNSVQIVVDAASDLMLGVNAITARQEVEGDNYENYDRFATVNVTPMTVRSDASPVLQVTVEPMPIAHVVGVFARGTAWTDHFLDALDVEGLGHASISRLGYAVPTGSGALQYAPLPWTNIDQLIFVFDTDVVVGDDDLTVSGVNVPGYGLLPGGFSYDPVSFVATWTLDSAVGLDQLTIALESDVVTGIHVAAGGALDAALDGEWDNPVDLSDPSSDTFASGDGTSGGDFVFRLDVHPGDQNQDGAVDVTDILAAFSNFTGPQPGTPSFDKMFHQGDLNGDADVDVADLLEMFARYTGPADSGVSMFAAAMFGAAASTAPVTVDSVTVDSVTDDRVADTRSEIAAVDETIDETIDGPIDVAAAEPVEVPTHDRSATSVTSPDASISVHSGPVVLGPGWHTASRRGATLWRGNDSPASDQSVGVRRRVTDSSRPAAPSTRERAADHFFKRVGEYGPTVLNATVLPTQLSDVSLIPKRDRLRFRRLGKR